MNYEIEAVEVVATAQGDWVWRVDMRKPDGSLHCHSFPPKAIEWRMAEYGLDSVDEALDMVLHEPYAVDPLDTFRDAAGLDPVARAGMTVRLAGKAAAEPVRLHNAPTIADAREAHRLRIADAKTRVRVRPPKGKTDPLDVIREQHGVTEAGLRVKTALVDAARCGVRGEPVPEKTRRVLAEIHPAYRTSEEASHA